MTPQTRPSPGLLLAALRGKNGAFDYVSRCCCGQRGVYPARRLGYHSSLLSIAETISGQLIK